MKIREIWTAHDTVVQLDQTTGQVCHAATLLPGCLPVLACFPLGSDRFCVLIPPDAADQAIFVGGDGRQDAIGMQVGRTTPGQHTLRHPLSGLYLCAEPVEGTQNLIANRHSVGPWEQFRFQLPSCDTAPFTSNLGRLEATFQHAGSPGGLLELLRSDGAGLRFALAASIRAFRPDEIMWLGRALGRDAEAARRLARHMPDDVWASEALPCLADFSAGVARQEPPSSRRIDERLDYLAQTGFSGAYASIGQMLNAAARRDVVARRTLCVVATARNEGLYLLEWLAYHRLAGVEAFFLYTNDNDDGSDELLSALDAAGVVNWIDNHTAQGVSPQYKAYGHAFQIMPEILDYRWAAVIDLDEFVVVDPAKYCSIPDFLRAREAEPTDAIALNWLIFGSAGKRHWSPHPVIDRFTRRAPGSNPLVKSICRPNTFIHAHCHYPIWDQYTEFAFRTATGSPHPRQRANDAPAFSPIGEVQDAWINHYSAKSGEEYLLRRMGSRGDMALALSQSTAYFTSDHARFFLSTHDQPGTINDDRAQHGAPALASEIAALTALPGVAAAVANIEQAFRQRVRDLAPILAGDERFQVPDSPEKWFSDLLAEQGH